MTEPTFQQSVKMLCAVRSYVELLEADEGGGAEKVPVKYWERQYGTEVRRLDLEAIEETARRVGLSEAI